MSLLATGAGLVAGQVYFQIGEKGQPVDSNCSYLSPASTDWLAVLAGGLLAWRGIEDNDPLVSAIGAAVLSIHTAQWWHYKRSQG